MKVRVFLIFCLANQALSRDPVQIVGLFPKEVDNDVSVPGSPGVKLDQRTAWSRHCIAMFRAAIQLAHQYKIRVHNSSISHTVLETSDDGNGFAFLNYICQLISNDSAADIVGIVGPSSSASARFLAMFAGHVGLPLISYGATNADLTDNKLYPTFYRTVPSDALLAKAIISSFELFRWKTCSIIFQKDDYGYGGLNILTKSYYRKVTIKDRLIFDALSDTFDIALNDTLGKSESRIVLVWANESSSTRIIQHAIQAGLVGGDFVWILTDLVDLYRFESKDWHLLKGLLAVMPMDEYYRFPEIDEKLLNDAIDIWRTSPLDNVSFPDDRSLISPFALFTFDATWTLIRALNKSSLGYSPRLQSSFYCFNNSLKNSAEYNRHIKETSFLGVSGPVQFSRENPSNRIEGAHFVLKNLQLEKSFGFGSNMPMRYKRVMRWRETTDSCINLTDIDNTYIVWPNGSSDVPVDHPRIRGKTLNILVIEAPPFVMVRNTSNLDRRVSSPDIDDDHQLLLRSNTMQTNNPNITIYGYIVEFLYKLQKRMGFHIQIEMAPANISYHNLIVDFAANTSKWDIALSDITITSDRLLTVDFSVPIHENALRIVIRDNHSPFILNFFSFLSPFSWDVWLTLLALIMCSGILIYLFERKTIENETGETGARAAFTAIRHALTSVVSMNGDLHLTMASSRMITISLYTLSVVLVATYTANLSSFLTLQRTLPPISGIDDIKNGRLPFSRIGIVANSSISDYYTRYISSLYYPLSTSQDIYSHLMDNRIDAAVWDSTALEYTIDKKYCRKLVVVGVGFIKTSFGIAMPKKWPYKADFDLNIMALREFDGLDDLDRKWFQKRKCSKSLPSSSSFDETVEGQIDNFSLDLMGGLFLAFLGMSTMACALHLFEIRKSINDKIVAIYHRLKGRSYEIK